MTDMGEVMLMVLQAVGLITGLLGQWQIVQRKRSAFVTWSVSNVAIVAVQVDRGVYVLAGMFAVYLVLCMYAYLEWGKNDGGGGTPAGGRMEQSA